MGVKEYYLDTVDIICEKGNSQWMIFLCGMYLAAPIFFRVNPYPLKLINAVKYTSVVVREVCQILQWVL